MRKYLRAIAKHRMIREGYPKVNRLMNDGRWRRVVNAYPGFVGSKKPSQSQPVLTYPVPKGVKSWREIKYWRMIKC